MTRSSENTPQLRQDRTVRGSVAACLATHAGASKDGATAAVAARHSRTSSSRSSSYCSDAGGACADVVCSDVGGACADVVSVADEEKARLVSRLEVLKEGLNCMKKKQATTARPFPQAPPPLQKSPPGPKKKDSQAAVAASRCGKSPKTRRGRKKTGKHAPVAEASSGGSLVAAPLAAGHVASCAGSASARNEELGGGASLRGEQKIIASETVAAATAVKGTASATNKGNGRIASPRGEEEIQTSSSSSTGKIGASTAPTWCVGLGRR